MKTSNHDLIIIGGGSAGLGALGMASELGWKPLMIDKEEANIGGDCLNFGCVPSKALIHIAKYFYGAKRANEFGLQSTGKADMQKILDYIHSKQAVIREHESADYLRSQGVNLKIGEASFVDENTLKVNDEYLRSNRILLAAGSRPRQLKAKGIEHIQQYTNETIFYDLKELPDRLLVIGGGPIGCEMAQAFQRFGSQVTILNRGARILGVEREEVSELLTEVFRKEGIEILNNANLQEFSDANTAQVEIGNVQKELKFDVALIAIGRVLNSDTLNLQAAGIKTDQRGRPEIDDYLRTTNKNVFVAGDAAGMYQFSHGAEKHIQQLTYNFKNGFTRKHHVRDLSWVTFTDPEVASFGFTEKELKKQKINYWRQDQFLHKDDRAIVGEYAYGKMTLFLTPKSVWGGQRRILGGSLIAANAGEIIQELLLAANEGISAEAFIKKIYPYPTASRINQQTIKGVMAEDAKRWF